MIIFKEKLVNVWAYPLMHSRLIDSKFSFEVNGLWRAVRAVHPTYLLVHASDWAPPEADKGVNASSFPGRWSEGMRDRASDREGKK